MKETDDILQKVNHRDGMTVPEGFFADFSKRMEASLPEQEWERAPQAVVEPPRSFWAKVRPYVYMAAMFAGVWCMMHIFDFAKPATRPDLSFDTNAVVADAVTDDTFVNDYYLSTFSDYDLMNEMIDDGSVEDFDFETIE